MNLPAKSALLPDNIQLMDYVVHKLLVGASKHSSHLHPKQGAQEMFGANPTIKTKVKKNPTITKLI